MTVVVHTDILVSLQAMHGDVQRRFAELDRYRALKAIEQTIADFPDLDDVAHSLGDIRDRVQQQLDGTREFRALCSIERILPELSDILILLGGETDGKGDTASCTLNPGAESLADVEQDGSVPVGERDAVSLVEAATAAVDIEPVALAEAPEQPEDLPGPMTDPAHDAIADKAAGTMPGDRLPPRLESDPPASEAAPVPSLADSVAQLMAQAVVPPSRDPPTAPDWSAGAGTDARPQSPAERAA